VQQLESFFNFKDGEFRYTVIGFVSAVTKKLVSAYRLVDDRWTSTSKEPTAYFAEVLTPLTAKEVYYSYWWSWLW